MNQKRISYYSGYALRGIAMLVIIFSHCINEYSFYDSTWCRILSVPQFGVIGCSLFFLMSGYGLFSSLTMKAEELNVWKYLMIHLVRMLIPFILTFVLTFLAVRFLPPQITRAEENRIVNLFLLAMPNGIDMWFFKVIIINYLVTSVLFMIRTDNGTRIIILLSVHLLMIVLCHILKAPGYWYCSNLSFVSGALLATDGKTLFCRMSLLLSVALTVAYLLLSCMDINKTPVVIAGNVAICILAAWALTEYGMPRCRFLEFIGKNSLYFYLFDVPVMVAIPGDGMNLVAYFAVNVLVTLLLTVVYLSVRNRMIMPAAR